MLTYAITDIHGCLDQLNQALNFIVDDAGERPHRVVFLGDYIDRGPNSRGVLDRLMTGPGEDRVEWVFLRGNHDEMMLQSLRYRCAEHEECWLRCGGLETLHGYNRAEPLSSAFDLDREALDRHLDFIQSMPFYFEDDKRTFAHAGIDGRGYKPGDEIEMTSQNPSTLMWQTYANLEAFWTGSYSKLVVHGHTPRKKALLIENGRLNLDTGAVYGGYLTVARFDTIKDKEITSVTQFWPRKSQFSVAA